MTSQIENIDRGAYIKKTAIIPIAKREINQVIKNFFLPSELLKVNNPIIKNKSMETIKKNVIDAFPLNLWASNIKFCVVSFIIFF